jgi:hypothetical protein
MPNTADPKTPERQPSAEPRYELVFESNLVGKGPRPRRPSGTTLSSVLRELKALRERGGAALGDAYALAAKSFLQRWESFEDRAAERRIRQRAQGRRATAPAAAKASQRPKISSPTK